MKVVVYLRISQDRTGEELGVTRQREDCEQLAARRGWAVQHVYVDNDISAASGKRRPAWEAMMTDISTGQVDVVIGWTIDRTLRTGRDRLRMLELGKAHGITIAIARGSDMDLSTPAGRLAADILGAVAQNEIEVKGDRQRRAAQQAAELGKPPKGPRPFGFEPDRIQHNDREAAAIQDAYTAVLTGETLAGIARRWNAAGLRSARHGADEPPGWRAETVRALLLKPRNAGIRAYRGQEVGPAVWAPIVPEEIYRAAVAVLTDASRRQSTPVGRYLLSGIARCGVCGGTVQAGTRASYHTYRCRTKGHVARRGDVVEELVTGVVLERLSRPDARELLIDHTRPDVSVLRERARALRARLETVAAEFGSDLSLTPREYRAMRQPVLDQLAITEAEIADAGRVDLLGALVTAQDLRATWDESGRERQRAVIDTLLTIRLHPAGRGARFFDPLSVEMEWRTE